MLPSIRKASASGNSTQQTARVAPHCCRCPASKAAAAARAARQRRRRRRRQAFPHVASSGSISRKVDQLIPIISIRRRRLHHPGPFTPPSHRRWPRLARDLWPYSRCRPLAIMVHIPVLKIDVPDPDISALLPAALGAAIGALTAAYDALTGFLHPLPPGGAALYDAEAVAVLPREIRKARKRIRERRIDDPDKQSSELEEAAFAYYRRMIRTGWAGFSDEDPEDASFRRLTQAEAPGLLPQREAGSAAGKRGLPPQPLAATSPGRSRGQGPSAVTDSAQRSESGADVVQGGDGRVSSAATPGGAAAVISRGELPASPERLASLPGAGQRVVVTSAAGGAGLALGVGLVRLGALLAKLRRGSKRQAGRGGGAVAKGVQRRGSLGSGPSGRGSEGIGTGGGAGGLRQSGATRQQQAGRSRRQGASS
jgi:hypothetical protein